MSKKYKIDVYFVENVITDLSKLKFNKNVKLIPVPDAPSSFKRKVNAHTLFYLKNAYVFDFIKSRHKKYDLIYCHDLPTLYPAVKLKEHYNCKLIYDTHEIFIETINQFFPRKSHFIKAIIFKIIIFLMRIIGHIFENNAIKKTDLLLTVNSSCLTQIEKKYQFHYGHVVPNLPEFRLLPSTKQLRGNNNISPETFIVLYQGILNEGRYLREIIASANYFNDDMLLVLIGNGQMKEELMNYTRKNNLTNKVLFISHIPYSDLFTYTADANLGIMFNEHINLSKEYAFANKVTEYMACKLPVLLSDSPEYKRLLNKENIGSIISNYSPKNIALTINKLTKEKEKLTLQGENGMKLYQEEMHWEKHEPHFLELVNGVLE
jgi:glycosyltransferase involved in cell wall biosynthesis